MCLTLPLEPSLGSPPEHSSKKQCRFGRQHIRRCMCRRLLSFRSSILHHTRPDSLIGAIPDPIFPQVLECGISFPLVK